MTKNEEVLCIAIRNIVGAWETQLLADAVNTARELAESIEREAEEKKKA